MISATITKNVQIFTEFIGLLKSKNPAHTSNDDHILNSDKLEKVKRKKTGISD